MPRVTDIYNYIDLIAPFDLQEEWDNSGFLVGDGNTEVTSALMALDATPQLIEAAYDGGFQLVITHHPIIFRPQKTLINNNPAFIAAKKNIAVISAHTSYDCAEGGVSDVLAGVLGLEGIRKSESGEFRYGEIPETTVEDFAKAVKKRLDAHVSFCCGGKKVKTVAVCGGAGSDFLLEAKAHGADVFVTGEARHHDFLDACENDIGLITAGHFETENISMRPLKEKLKNKFADVQFVLYNQKSPINNI